MISAEEQVQHFKDLMEKKENNACFDCGSQNPTYTSINNGIFICDDCCKIHCSLQQNMSLCRSITEDHWTLPQLRLLQVGGNQQLKEFFENYNIQENSPIEFKFRTKAAQHYRTILYGKALQLKPAPSLEEGLELIEDIQKDKQKDEISKKFDDIASTVDQKLQDAYHNISKIKEHKTTQKVIQKLQEGSEKVGTGLMQGFQFLKTKFEKTSQSFQEYQSDKQKQDEKKFQYNEEDHQ